MTDDVDDKVFISQSYLHNSINGAIAPNIRRSREQCKRVCKLPRREQYKWPQAKYTKKRK